MKFKVEKSTLLNAIQSVQNVITPKSTLPILNNILIEAQTNRLRLTATDLDIGINCVIPVDTQETGSITVPAKRFGDIIRELPEENIVLSAKKNYQVTIEMKNCQFKIMGLPPEEFPKLPEFQNIEVIKIEQTILKEMLRLTAFAVSSDESRYILSGILFNIKNNLIVLVATDGKRLAIIERKIIEGSNKESNIIVPLKTINELTRHLKDEGDMAMVINNNQILFDLGKMVIISRLIEGEFPDYKQVIPQESPRKFRIEREQFLLGVKRAALLATPDYQVVKLEIFKERLVISKSTPDIGESREELPIEYKDKEMVIGFNPTYLMDVLKSLECPSLDLEISDSEKPGVIRVDGYTYIVLPMRLG